MFLFAYGIIHIFSCVTSKQKTNSGSQRVGSISVGVGGYITSYAYIIVVIRVN